MTGQPARVAAWPTTSSAGAPDTASSVNTWCIRSAARSSASWLSMISACTDSVISMNWVSRSNTSSGSRWVTAAATSASGRLREYREPSSTASALTPTEARSATYRARPPGSPGSAMPVDSTSSPPRSRCAASASSITWTQRTGESSRSVAASTRGAPRRTGSRASTSATVGSIGPSRNTQSGQGGRNLTLCCARPARPARRPGRPGPSRLGGQPPSPPATPAPAVPESLLRHEVPGSGPAGYCFLVPPEW